MAGFFVTGRTRCLLAHHHHGAVRGEPVGSVPAVVAAIRVHVGHMVLGRAAQPVDQDGVGKAFAFVGAEDMRMRQVFLQVMLQFLADEHPVLQAECPAQRRDLGGRGNAAARALAGGLDQAISMLSSASSQVKLGSQQQARYDARIDQLRQLQERFKPYTKM